MYEDYQDKVLRFIYDANAEILKQLDEFRIQVLIKWEYNGYIRFVNFDLVNVGTSKFVQPLGDS